MPERYSPCIDYDRVAECDFAAMETDPDGDYYHKDDYAALEAERDKWLQAAKSAAYETNTAILERDVAQAECDELRRRLNRVARELRACHDERALAIAEGRDDG